MDEAATRRSPSELAIKKNLVITGMPMHVNRSLCSLLDHKEIQ
jgi:hypothetical protein